MATNFGQNTTSYKVACCLYNTAVNLLEQCDLRVPENGGVDHRGPNFVCCDSLTVHWGNALPGQSAQRRDPCVDPHEREFVITYIGTACTEGEGVAPCRQADADKCVDENGDTCIDPEPLLAEPGCEGQRPTVRQETSAVWAIRELLETEIICAAKPCLMNCAGIRCGAISFTSSENVTEGGCFIVELRVNIEW